MVHAGLPYPPRECAGGWLPDDDVQLQLAMRKLPKVRVEPTTPVGFGFQRYSTGAGGRNAPAMGYDILGPNFVSTPTGVVEAHARISARNRAHAWEYVLFLRHKGRWELAWNGWGGPLSIRDLKAMAQFPPIARVGSLPIDGVPCSVLVDIDRRRSRHGSG